VNGQDSRAEIFDVFLCHNSEDKPAVRGIAEKLKNEGIKPWLDVDEIRPGTSWQTALGQQIGSIRSAAVFVGESGLGPWQDQEIQALLSQFVKRQCPVIPAVLPSAKETPELPWTLANLHWVDLRVTNPDPFKQLIWGITGQKPREESQYPPPRISEALTETDLLPRKNKVVIEVRLPGNLNEFSDKERDRILSGLNSLLEVGEVLLTRAIAGSIRLHLELTPEDADKIYAATKTGQLTALGISEVRLYPAIAIPPDEENRFQLLILLERVKETWVDGVLRNSIYNQVLISLGKRPVEEAVEPPLKYAEFSSRLGQILPQDRNIATIFDATGLLLILGEPGSGKTTTLLDLAANLFARAKVDSKERVPVVFNLSSWRRKQPLEEWMSHELSQKYRVPPKLALSWLQNDYLAPLLDGLDEVQSALQPDCVAAINDFISRSQPSGLVVCCRLTEYQWLPQRLQLNGALCLEPLSHEEVNKYLADGGSTLAALRKAIEADRVLQELAQTPLMLSIMSLACQGTDVGELATQEPSSSEERRKQIFRVYVEQMIHRKGVSHLVFPKEKIIGWLSWLARKMRKHSESVFLVEELHPYWLGTGLQRKSYEAVAALGFGMIFGLISGLFYGRTYGPLYGLNCGLICGLTMFIGVEISCWSKSPLKTSVAGGLILGLIGGLINWHLQQIDLLIGNLLEGLITGLTIGLIIGVISKLAGVYCGLDNVSLKNGISIGAIASWRWDSLCGAWDDLRSAFGTLKSEWDMRSLFNKIVTLIMFVVVWPVFVLVLLLAVVMFAGPLVVKAVVTLLWLFRGFVAECILWVKRGEASSNREIVSLIGFFITCLTAGLVTRLITGPRNGLADGLITGLFVALSLDGRALVKHYALRLILWLNGDTPFSFIKFLDQCAKLILMKRVGGGYIFIHRMLLDYFADLPPVSSKDGDGKTLRSGL
jgi:eukaryotic-like serine/threonine-protein kinase